MPNSDKEYYLTLLNTNGSEFETSDAPDEQRLVDEVPSGPVTRKRAASSKKTEDAKRKKNVNPLSKAKKDD